MWSTLLNSTRGMDSGCVPAPITKRRGAQNLPWRRRRPRSASGVEADCDVHPLACCIGCDGVWLSRQGCLPQESRHLADVELRGILAAACPRPGGVSLGGAGKLDGFDALAHMRA